MRIIFVRHANPDYESDTLTELGVKQADAVAKRLMNEGVFAIYSSSMGRAMETAEKTAKKIGLSVTPCEFMREISWSSLNGEPISDGGQPWLLSRRMVARGESLMLGDWKKKELFSKSETVMSAERVAEGLDAWLSELGYLREGEFYRVTHPNHDTVAMFCHAGSFSAAFAHLFNLPLPFVCATLPLSQAAIVEVDFTSISGDLITPRMSLINDKRHLSEIK